MPALDVPGLPPWAQVVTAADRPDLWQEWAPAFRSVWPEYNHHGDVSGVYFGALLPAFADLQVLIVRRADDTPVARGRAFPLRWDGTLTDLPAGVDPTGLRAVDDHQAGVAPTVLCALAAEVAPRQQGQGLSSVLLTVLRAVARAHGLRALIAPVRPSQKAQHPLVPIDRYARWRRPDGLPTDPWLRVHAGMGATVLRPEPCSMRITAPAKDWTRWTGTPLHADGRHVFPEGLAPLVVAGGIGRYFEPNVWMAHPA